jgi:hypothetical protein
MRLAARALAKGGISLVSPIMQEGLIDRYFPEAAFRERQNQKTCFPQSRTEAS